MSSFQLTRPRCTDWIMTFQFFNDVALTSPTILTDYKALFILAQSELAPPILTGSTLTGEIVIDGPTGLVTVTFPNTETDIPSGPYTYFLKLEDPVNFRETQPLTGPFVISVGRREPVTV